MKIRSVLSVIFIMLAVLVLSGCALSHPAAFAIVEPQNGNTFPLNQSIIVKVRVNVDPSHLNNGNWQSYEWEMWDAGSLISSGTESTYQREFAYALNSTFAGAHYISVRARGKRADTDQITHRNVYSYSDWRTTNEVCFYAGPNAPSDFCSVRTIAQPLTIETFTPTPPPTSTPVTPIIVRPNPHNPGGTNPTGCAAFNDQTSCNLAGCSWNGTSCEVNP